MRRKALLLLALFCALAVFLGSCTQKKVSESGKAGNGEVRVAFSQCQSSDPWRVAQINDVMRAAKEHGYDLIYTDAQGDMSKQISDIEDICAQGVDYLIFDPRETEAGGTALEIAKKAGVKVILIDRLAAGAPGVDYITYIGTDFVFEGKGCGEWVVKNLGGKAKVVEVYGTPGSSAAEDRHKGFMDAIANTGVEIIASQPADFTRSKAQQVVENIIQSTGGQFDVIFTHNDEMGMGAIQAIKSAGFQPGKDIKVVSCDGQQEAVKAIIAGEMGCTVTCNPLYGNITFETLDKIIAGGTVPTQIILEDYVIDASNAEEKLPLAF